MDLPRGVGLVRIRSPFGIVVLTSQRLTKRQEEVGQIAASAIGRGCPVVILTEVEILRLMEEVAVRLSVRLS